MENDTNVFGFHTLTLHCTKEKARIEYSHASTFNFPSTLFISVFIIFYPPPDSRLDGFGNWRNSLQKVQQSTFYSRIHCRHPCPDRPLYSAGIACCYFVPHH